jgi:succinyl-diaminopimelate desuccinylase
MVRRDRLIRLAQEVVRIPSENPPGDERRLAAFVARYLKKAGLAPRLHRFFPGRDNVLAVLKGSSRRGSLLITPHLDTVPAGSGWTQGPFSGTLKAGKIYGRGATDCKGNLAVAIEVMQSLVEDKTRLQHDLIFLATADEETGSHKGLKPFLEKNIIKPSSALILDSDEFYVITCQKGLIHFQVKVFGKKAHGAYPHRGVNAIDGAIELISVLKNLKPPFRRHRHLKPPTINIGTIRGGDKVNMVPDACAFEVDWRFLPGMDARDLLSRMRRAFDQTAVRYDIVINDIQQPYEIDERDPLVSCLRRASRTIGRNGLVKGSEGATVITFFQKKKIPAVATGWGASGCAHATDEYARAADLYQGAIVLERAIKLFDSRRESC